MIGLSEIEETKRRIKNFSETISSRELPPGMRNDLSKYVVEAESIVDRLIPIIQNIDSIKEEILTPTQMEINSTITKTTKEIVTETNRQIKSNFEIFRNESEKTNQMNLIFNIFSIAFGAVGFLALLLGFFQSKSLDAYVDSHNWYLGASDGFPALRQSHIYEHPKDVFTILDTLSKNQWFENLNYRYGDSIVQSGHFDIHRFDNTISIDIEAEKSSQNLTETEKKIVADSLETIRKSHNSGYDTTRGDISWRIIPGIEKNGISIQFRIDNDSFPFSEVNTSDDNEFIICKPVTKVVQSFDDFLSELSRDRTNVVSSFSRFLYLITGKKYQLVKNYNVNNIFVYGKDFDDVSRLPYLVFRKTKT